MNQGIKILSIEAKDLYAASCLVEPSAVGYDIRSRDGKINISKFENTLDWSLDSMKLQEAYEKETRRKSMSFSVRGKQYSQIVINVKFTYSFKEFNKCGKNTYVRAGYMFRNCHIEDGAYVKDGKLVAIQTNVEIMNPLPKDILGDCFSFIDGHYIQTGNIPVLMNKAELRDYIYKNGFVCDGIKYIRYKRSSGSSRVGKCLFVNEIVAKRMTKWDSCGLKINDGDEIDLAAYEAYIALPMSSIIDTIQIEPENILVVEDYNSIFTDTVVAVECEDNKLVSSEKEMKISNCIWDGESLLDKSMFGKYESKGMLLLRNRFFKTCAFNANIQQWFADNGIADVSELNGFTLATDISQIKMITTPSSVKYLKFGKIEQWLENIDHTFGIVKHEKETHFFGGRMVQCHYQLLNTLQLSYDDMKEVLKPSLEYIGAVRSDPAVLRYHIGYSFKAEDDDDVNPYKTKNDIIFKMLGINDTFAKTKIYKDFRDTIVRGFFRNLKRGHILLNGNYSTLLGNGIELLQQAIGKFSGESVLDKECIHSKRFEYGKKILGTRSPHITMANVLLVKNEENELIDRYLNLTNEIVYINSIGDNILQRLNGSDFDSDSLLLTDNITLIASAEKNYEYFKVPTSFVDAKKTKRKYTASDKSDLDMKTSVNKIGEIVNLSQELNSRYWDMKHKGRNPDTLKELYEDICKLAVLSGIEIDAAKKEFVIDSGKEIDSLKKKYRIDNGGRYVKPMFFKMITLENGYELSDNIHHKYFNTPMDHLQKIISSTNFKQARESKIDVVPFMDVVREPRGTKSGYYKMLRDSIIETIKTYKAQIAKTYIDYEKKDSDGKLEAREKVSILKQECIDVIDSMSSHEYLMYIVLKEVEKKENCSIRGLMFEVLFGKPNETFMQMIKESREPISVLKEDENGYENYYLFKYSRVKTNQKE